MPALPGVLGLEIVRLYNCSYFTPPWMNNPQPMLATTANVLASGQKTEYGPILKKLPLFHPKKMDADKIPSFNTYK